MSKEQGKIVEKFVWDQLRALMDEYPLFVHRFVDSHDAGRFVSPQPSDLYFFSDWTGSMMVEVKSSQVAGSLRDDVKSLFSPQQIGKMKLLERAGQTILCIFYSEIHDIFE